MRHQITLASLVVALAACAHAPATVAPRPVSAAPDAATRPAATDSTAHGPSAPATSPAVTQAAAQAPTSAAAASSADPAPPPVSAGEVSRGALGVFGDSVAPAASPAEHDSSAADDTPSWDIDVQSYESTDRVEHYVQLFSGPARERIAARLDVGSRYEPMIRAAMRDGGLPEDMYYLALIESGFDPNAYSRAAAVGMWQFMASTARGMGMRVDWWVDERRDPVKSTVAAVRFIRGLKEQFGSLYLAAAAYNGGPGRIARGLTRYADDLDGTSGDDLFFALAEKDYLKHETKEYVPQLIAAAIVAKEPAKFGMELHPQPPFAYDTVRVPGSTPLAAIAHASGATVEQIRELNPQILRGMTPPRTEYRVRIPPGTRDHFDSAFAALPKAQLVAYKRVESKKGDRLETLSDRYGVSVRGIEALNPHIERSRKTGRLVAGQEILIPTPAVAAAVTNAPDPTIERYPGSRSGATTFHVVKRGETLGGIAKHYHTSVKSLMRLNGMRREMIFPGQELVVSGHASSVRSTSARRSRKSSGSESSRGKEKSSSKRAKGSSKSSHTRRSAPASTSRSSGKSSSKSSAKSASSTASR